MDDDIQQCGNDLRFIEWYLIHHGKGPGDPIKQLASLTQAIVQVLVSAQISNEKLGREFRSESAVSLKSAANQFASIGAVPAHV